MSGNLTWLVGKWTKMEDVFPIQHEDLQASQQGLRECTRVIVHLLLVWYNLTRLYDTNPNNALLRCPGTEVRINGLFHLLIKGVYWVYNPQKRCWLIVSTHLKNISQTGNIPQFSGWKQKIFETTTQGVTTLFCQPAPRKCVFVLSESVTEAQRDDLHQRLQTLLPRHVFFLKEKRVVNKTSQLHFVVVSWFSFKVNINVYIHILKTWLGR